MALINDLTRIDPSWLRKAFLQEYDPPRMIDWFAPKRPTVESIARDVAKLRSVSAAGRRWIEDRRQAIASVGKYSDTFFLKDERGGYPAIMMKSRQSGATWSIRREINL